MNACQYQQLKLYLVKLGQFTILLPEFNMDLTVNGSYDCVLILHSIDAKDRHDLKLFGNF